MRQRLRILHLETDPHDAELIAELVRTALVADGLEVDFVRVDTRAAFLAALDAGDVSLILSDYVLPEFDGGEALALAREKCPEVPFIFVSETIGEERAIETLKSGATDYVLKERLQRLGVAVQRAFREVAERAAWRRTEEALRQSGERYRSLFENANDGIVTFTLDGTFTSVNQGLERMLGWSREELIGQRYHAIATPASAALGDERTRRALAGEKLPLSFEAEMLHKNGHVVLVDVHDRFLRNAQGRPIGTHVIFRDITARKRVEAALRTSEERFQGIARATNDVLWDWDSATNALWRSESILTLFGYTPDEMEPTLTWWSENIHPEDRDRVVAKFYGLLDSGGQSWSDEYRYRRADGSYAHVFDRGYVLRDDRGKPVRMYGGMTDITAHKRAEAALRESEERYRNLFENANDAIVTFTLEGIVTGVNRGLEVMLGWAREELLGQHFRKFATPASVAQGEERTRRFLAGERPASIFELEIVGKDGRVVPVEARTRAIRDAAGTPIGIQGIYRDITERKRAEAALQESNRRLEDALATLQATQQQALQQERLAAVGQLAAGIAHDFNNILTSILGFAEFILLERELPSVVRESVTAILSQGERASKLIRQILDFSRQSAVQVQLVDMASALLEISTLLKRALPESIRLRFDITPGDFLILIDASQLQQVLTNLALNARDALLPQGGELFFRLSRCFFELGHPPTPDPGALSGHWTVLEVTDTGTGMPPEVQARIFEPFFTTKEVGQGTGLGLAQVYGIVKQHGGHITVQSQVGKGTTFTLYFPALFSAQAAGNGEAVAPETRLQELARAVRRTPKTGGIL
jgi:PAS domain S-box-containing protein